jgi:signal recognition particle receptor subunit beta
MALCNHVKKEINAKIVYFGPGGGGKETSVSHVYRKLNPDCRSLFKSMTVQGNRMLFFDFHPAEKGIEGYSVRFHLYTVADEVLKPSTWKTVLKGSDGVVFVADSDPARMQENVDRLSELESLLAVSGPGIDNVPLVMQYNRRDHPQAVPLDELQRRLNRFYVPVFPTVAATGEGVLAPLSSIIKMVLAKIRESLVEMVEPIPPQTAVPDVEPAPPVPAEEVAVVAPDEAIPEATAVAPPGAPDEPPPPNEEYGAVEISLEITGGGLLADGSLSVPITVCSGTTHRDFRLVISLAAEELNKE